MDITPAAPAGRLLVQAYGDGGFRIGGARHKGSVLLLPGAVLPWPVANFESLSEDDLTPVIDAAPPVEVLILGCGVRHRRLPEPLRAHLRAAGVSVDTMATGPACRTYNVLVTEDRRAAAALIAID